jgi:hypothetical protein
MNRIPMLLVVSSLLIFANTGCQQSPAKLDIVSAVQNAKTAGDHEALAAHYQQAAAEAETRVDEYKSLLQNYQKHSYLYGRRGPEFLEHCRTWISSYEKTADADRQLAKIHLELAAETP